MPVRLIAPTPSAYAFPLLIKHLLLTPLATVPEQTITYQGRVRYTYRTLKDRIGRLANVLAGLGVEAGQTVAVMDWDSHRYLEAFFAVPMMGAILQTVNVRFSPEQILYTLNHARADVLIVNSEFFAALGEIAGRLETVKTVVTIVEDSKAAAAPLAAVGEYEALLAGASADYAFPDFDENAQATTFYTTGTTGHPKGVHFSHRQLVLHTLGCAAALGGATTQGRVHREDVYMPLTPMFHVHAWGFPYLATMMGLKQVYPGRYQPELICRLVAEEKVSFSHCVPTILHMVMGHPLAKTTDFAGWKILIGGSALPEAMATAAQKRGIDLFTGYGMSETCPVLTIAHLDSAALAGSAESQSAIRAKTGRPLPLVDLRVVDPQMRDMLHDGKATGEVVVRAPWLTQAYVNAPEASEALWAGGYLHTADIGHIDAAGYLKVTDRIKDVIKTGGEWTSSLELENLIGKHEAVHEVAVIGVPDEKWGERPLALVLLKPEHADTITERALRNWAAHAIEAAGVSRYGVLLQVRFVKTLVKTSVGKMNKRLMRADPDALCL
ncbi:MAG TPA: fatty acid--CoA ligase [Zoogloea sp.]|uniref:fatty acid--CoA ligase n=1 Tax=Zoogloea sp. TaxID=49181 RepID=UPI002B56D9EC|nr:fatty acid--CoA ligase [Zoogloea sp.]HMV18503.1 fatty acid--CoA ligase [Rhodocyclaceae bacterium]HNG04149.1 fatty acid--CoA ligase [Nitrospira sp.]HMY51102.1 fatty acid--CoA ligase [Rhodocyclaceae bacterium]HNA69287.1 fatty acid--CoA ligase [Rhodocyclaceae bacterium]HNB65833.1 fatty acid--CoA ligase [Rhodocyclaceae bacterium]